MKDKLSQSINGGEGIYTWLTWRSSYTYCNQLISSAVLGTACPVFGLCWTTRNSSLFLGAPRNWIITQEHNISSCRPFLYCDHQANLSHYRLRGLCYQMCKYVQDVICTCKYLMTSSQQPYEILLDHWGTDIHDSQQMLCLV